MVYGGRPSKGCQMCKNRRIKCDEAKPSCSQCIKSKRQCPGYAEDFDLFFRDETRSTQRRAQRIARSKQHIAPHTPSVPSSDATRSSRKSSSPPATRLPFLAPSLSIDTESRALGFFFHNYTVLPKGSAAASRGYLEFLAPIYSETGDHSHLSLAVSAIASVTLGCTLRSGDIVKDAHKKYVAALSKTKLSLGNSEEVTSDGLLMTILILGLYENITCNNKQSLLAWANHVDGAMALVKMRGKENFTSERAKRLLMAVRSQLVISRIRRAKSLDDFEGDWEELYGDSPAAGLTRLSSKVPGLREMAHKLLALPKDALPSSEVVELMRSTKQLDCEMVDWAAAVPKEWEYRTVASLDGNPEDLLDSDVYPGNIDVYFDIWVASIWNNYRCTRLFLQGVMIRCIAWLAAPADFTETTAYWECALEACQLVNDVCASVPFHLGYRTSEKSADGSYPSPESSPGRDEQPRFVGLGGLFLIWPLFVAGCMDCIPEPQRLWLRKRLQFVADSSGIGIARLLSTIDLRLPYRNILKDGPKSVPESVRRKADVGKELRMVVEGDMSYEEHWEVRVDANGIRSSTPIVRYSEELPDTPTSQERPRPND